MRSFPRLLPLSLFLLFFAPDAALPADAVRIDGRAIDKALKQLYAAVMDKRVDAVPLSEMLAPGGQPVSARYKKGTVRMATDLLVDSLLTRSDVNISVFIEEEDHLSAELWKVYFEPEGAEWVPKRFKALIRANVGDVFAPAEEEMYRFESLTVRRDAAEFHITDGYLIPAAAAGQVGRAVVFGKGLFTFTPPDNVERQQLNKYARSKNATYIESFTQMVLQLSPDGFSRMIEGVDLKPVRDGRTFKRARALLNRVEKDYRMDVEPTRQQWSFVPTHPEYLRAEFDRTSSPNWLVYAYNPFEMEEVSLVQKSGFPRNFDLKPPVVWCHFSRTRPPEASAAPADGPRSTALLHINSYRIQGTLASNRKTLRLKTTVDAMALEDSVQVMTFMLNDAFRIRRVDYADGEGALFIKQGSFISVPLLEALPKGQRTTLTFWYEGDIIHRLGESFYTPLRNEQWLPQHSNRDSFVFDLEMRMPKSLMAITTGVKVLEYEEEDTKVARWQSLQPISLLGLTFSDHRAVTTRTQGVEVTVYTDKDLLKTASREKDILKLIDESLPFYSASFGAYPYEKLDIVQMPDHFQFGQGFPTLLLLWGLYFRSDYILDRDLSGNKFDTMQQFFKGFLAHELAHQWWGNVVVPKTYRDVWLSEGMATYAADLFIENVVGEKAFVDMLKNHTELARRADKEGAISLGQRLKEYYQPVVYDKGAMVLHMLRRICGDEKFYAILSTFYKNSFRRLVTTEDFRRVAEEVMERDMGWFFDQWILDTGYPVYRMSHTSIRREDQQYRVQCTLSQEQEGRIFTMPVPVRIELKNGERIETVIWNDRRYHTFEIVVPDEVKRIETAPDYAVYCDTAL